MGLFTRSRRDPTQDGRRSISVPAHKAHELLADGAVILDVREHHEWRAGHASGAKPIPLGEVGDSIEQIPCDCTVIVVCRSGHRSAQGVNVLRKAGIDAVNLHGGMHAWSSAGLPVRTPDGREGVIV